MIILVKCFLYGSLALFVHSYIFFPLIVGLLYFFRTKKNRIRYLKDENLPNVSILISVFNEEKIIRKKLESLLQTSYPIEKIQIFIGSDFSTDSTNSILQEFQEKYTNIHVAIFTMRRGKPQVLNDLMDFANALNPFNEGQMVIFTDANILLEKETIFRLLRNFKDPKVGLVDSRMVSGSLSNLGVANSEDNYIKLETRLKYWEGELWGCMMGAFGGCYAVRSNLLTKLPEKILVDDFYISMKVLEQDHENISDTEALAHESLTGIIQQEFSRKSRISSGNIQNLSFFGKSIFSRPFIQSFCFISHKVIRWLGPVLLFISFGTSLYLSLTQPGLHVIILLLLLIVLLFIPMLDKILKKGGINWSLIRNISYFAWMNLALFNGLLRYYRGIRSSIWEPTKRT